MKESPNCVNIGTKWYYIEELTLNTLFFEILIKIKENKLNIESLKHEEIGKLLVFNSL